MRNKKILKLVQNAMLSAIILLLTLTPLGYLPIGPLEVTVMMIPVAIGAMTLGISSGVILGGVFGLSSFLTCLGILRPSSFGQMLFAINPWSTAIVCFIPRILMGLICALLFKALYKKFGDKLGVYAAVSASAALVNTILFMGGLVLFFHGTMSDVAAGEGKSLFLYILAISVWNCLGEIAASVLVGTPVAKAIHKFLERKD